MRDTPTNTNYPLSSDVSIIDPSVGNYDRFKIAFLTQEDRAWSVMPWMFKTLEEAKAYRESRGDRWGPSKILKVSIRTVEINEEALIQGDKV